MIGALVQLDGYGNPSCVYRWGCTKMGAPPAGSGSRGWNAYFFSITVVEGFFFAYSFVTYLPVRALRAFPEPRPVVRLPAIC